MNAEKAIGVIVAPLTEQLEAARRDATEAEAYAAELEARLATCEKYRDAYAECDRIATQAVRDLEARLEKAVNMPSKHCDPMDMSDEDEATLAELKGRPE
jgi:RNase H-fold protein (predicted Holliday junction resolvase)